MFAADMRCVDAMLIRYKSPHPNTFGNLHPQHNLLKTSHIHDSDHNNVSPRQLSILTSFISMTVPLPEEQSLPPLPSLPASLRKQVFTHPSAISPSLPQSYDLLLQLGNSVLHVILTRALLQHPSCRESRLLQKVREAYSGRDNVEKWGIQYGMLRKVQVAGGLVLRPEGKEGKCEKGIAGDVFTAYIGALDFVSNSSFHRSNESTNGRGSDNSDPESSSSTQASVPQHSI